VAFVWRVGKGVLLGGGEGLVASWSTDAPAGFTEAQVELLLRILPALTLVIMFRTNLRAARTLITTYLGSDAAERVLAGNIVRGRAEPLRAVLAQRPRRFHAHFRHRERRDGAGAPE
jgi:adenylate cyclase